MINWNIFDKIWCIHYTGYKEREELIHSELDRVGILNSGIFQYQYTFNSVFNKILYDVTKNQLHANNTKNENSFNCSLGHFSCIKTSYDLGHNFILILEDDVKFLKDLLLIENILNNIPKDGNIILFDTLPVDYKTYNDYITNRKHNNYFASYDLMYSVGCYALDREAMKDLIMRYEYILEPADIYTSSFANKNFKKYFSIESLTCQYINKNSNNVKIYGESSMERPYKIKNLDYSKYQ